MSLVIDAHTHIFPPEIHERREHYVSLDGTFSELYVDPKAKLASTPILLRDMTAQGVDVSVVMGIGWTDIGLAREANDYIIESVRNNNDKLLGFAGVNPLWGQAAAYEAERCAKAGLLGIGELHPDTQGLNVIDPGILNSLIEVAREFDLIFTIHTSEPVGHNYIGKGTVTPERIIKLIENHPDVTFILAHWGGGLPFYSLMPEVAKILEKVYFDTAASPYLYDSRIFEVVARAIGSNKILLGSDYPLMSHSRLRTQIDQSNLSDADKRGILGANAARILKYRRSD